MDQIAEAWDREYEGGSTCLIYEPFFSENEIRTELKGFYVSTFQELQKPHPDTGRESALFVIAANCGTDQAGRSRERGIPNCLRDCSTGSEQASTARYGFGWTELSPASNRQICLAHSHSS
jgi:hypothetical protein